VIKAPALTPKVIAMIANKPEVSIVPIVIAIEALLDNLIRGSNCIQIYKINEEKV
jgi:hypothetical protein